MLFVNKSNTDNPYILVVNCENDKAESNVMNIVKDKVKKHVVKSKTVTGGKGIEVAIEVRLKSMETEFVNEISRQNGVLSAVMVSYNGDYMS